MDQNAAERQQYQNINESFNSFMSTQGHYSDAEVQELLNLNIVVHQITFDDTLEGLALQYGVSPCVIRDFNGITSDSIYYLKSLQIPNPRDFNESENPKTTELTLQGFKKIYMTQYVLEGDDKSDKIAQYYLDVNDWVVAKAAQEYYEDLKYEKSQKNVDKDIHNIPLFFKKMDKSKVRVE